MKPTILFDIDLTLLNTNHFREAVDVRFAEALKVELGQITKTKDAYKATLAKSTDFNPDGYIKGMCKDFKADKNILARIYFQMPRLYRESLYPETRTALKKLQTGYRLGVFTEGFRKFQLTKLKLAGLLPFFDRNLIFIHRRKLRPSALNRLPEGAVIVDDNWEVIEELQTYPKIRPIWLNRKGDKEPLNVTTITSLSELLPLQSITCHSRETCPRENGERESSPKEGLDPRVKPGDDILNAQDPPLEFTPHFAAGRG